MCLYAKRSHGGAPDSLPDEKRRIELYAAVDFSMAFVHRQPVHCLAQPNSGPAGPTDTDSVDVDV